MQEITLDKLQIAYEGPTLQEGKIPMLALAEGLRGQALLIDRAKNLLYGESITIRVEVNDEFETGSFIIPVHILFESVKPIEDFLTSPGFTAITNLLGVLGFSIAIPITLYDLFKRLKGRKIEKVEDLPKNLKT